MFIIIFSSHSFNHIHQVSAIWLQIFAIDLAAQNLEIESLEKINFIESLAQKIRFIWYLKWGGNEGMFIFIKLWVQPIIKSQYWKYYLLLYTTGISHR